MHKSAKSGKVTYYQYVLGECFRSAEARKSTKKQNQVPPYVPPGTHWTFGILAPAATSIADPKHIAPSLEEREESGRRSERPASQGAIQEQRGSVVSKLRPS
jgi:hypothetical protein